MKGTPTQILIAASRTCTRLGRYRQALADGFVYVVSHTPAAVMEMFRRFVLVGIFVVVLPGTMLQLALASLFSLLYTAILLQAQPYLTTGDNVMALITSVSICVVFLVCIFLKLTALVETESIKGVMAPRQQDVFYVPSMALIYVFGASVFTAFGFVGLLAMFQTAAAKRRRVQDDWSQQLRRLRYENSGKVVQAKDLPENQQYHVFLSHGTHLILLCCVQLRP